MRFRTVVSVCLSLFVLAALGVVVGRSVTRPSPAIASAPRAVRPPAVVVAESSSAVETTSSEAREATGQPARTASLPPSRSVAARATVAIPSPPDTTVRRHKVVATYFHGNVRCTTCRKVEAYAREAVEIGFPREVAQGTVEFRAINVELPENAHFVQDYGLTNKSVIVTDEVNGAVVRWAKLDEVWSLVGNHDAYLQYVQDAVRGTMETE